MINKIKLKTLDKHTIPILIISLIIIIVSIIFIINSAKYLYYNYNEEERCWNKYDLNSYNIWSYNNINIARPDNNITLANTTFNFYQDTINLFENMTGLKVYVKNITTYYLNLKDARLCCSGYSECVKGNGTRIYATSVSGDNHEIIHIILNNKLSLPNPQGFGFEEAFVTRLTVIMAYFKDNRLPINSEHIFLNKPNLTWEKECEYTLKEVKDYDRNRLCKYDSLIRRLERTYTDDSKEEILSFWVEFLRKVYEIGGLNNDEELFNFIIKNYENSEKKLKKWGYIS